jgi:hypothetical protein
VYSASPINKNKNLIIFIFEKVCTNVGRKSFKNNGENPDHYVVVVVLQQVRIFQHIKV